MRIQVTREMKNTTPDELLRAGRAFGWTLVELRSASIWKGEKPKLWVVEFEAPHSKAPRVWEEGSASDTS